MEFEGQFGSWIVPLGSCDEADLVRLLQRLDEPSRVGRFGAVTSDPVLAAHARRALTHADWISSVVMETGLRAVAEIYKLGSRAPCIAEAAFVVEQRWRRCGIATALLHASVEWARGSGIETLRMVFLRSNWPMRKLARKGRATLSFLDEEISADISVADRVQR
jgi:GNAT superfamily N-acetyltransferase